jgi:SpoVK/Ycf46/Vps4 family AAA+-type ATPase
MNGNLTPTLSERKKAVSFSDPLEEVYIVESFKTNRPKSADKYRRRRHRFERQYITPL